MLRVWNLPLAIPSSSISSLRILGLQWKIQLPAGNCNFLLHLLENEKDEDNKGDITNTATVLMMIPGCSNTATHPVALAPTQIVAVFPLRISCLPFLLDFFLGLPYFPAWPFQSWVWCSKIRFLNDFAKTKFSMWRYNFCTSEFLRNRERAESACEEWNQNFFV